MREPIVRSLVAPANLTESQLARINAWLASIGLDPKDIHEIAVTEQCLVEYRGSYCDGKLIPEDIWAMLEGAK